MVTLDEMKRLEQEADSPAYLVNGWRGIYFRYIRPEVEWRATEPDEWPLNEDGDPLNADLWWPDEEDGDYVETGMALMCMVGDDMLRVVDPVECTPYMGPVCSCGQVGCGWHGQQEE